MQLMRRHWVSTVSATRKKKDSMTENLIWFDETAHSSHDQVDSKYVFSDAPGATWVSEALPGQSTTLRGTMQEIRRGIEAINPAYLANLNASAEDPEGGGPSREAIGYGEVPVPVPVHGKLIDLIREI
ncbi:hypothetical protein EsDP_00002414 [Epichloe bromicola]|uniref:Uncharacterized protein n=1 Tax=Epichloe bromicola TaxID=79588 RepID=A0ABQ0CKS0_9HYPO